MVAFAVGGISDQIVDWDSGLLPANLDGFAVLLGDLLADQPYAATLGAAARRAGARPVPR